MKRIIAACTVALLTVSISAKADIFNFYGITTYTNTGFSSVVAQMTMEVSPIDATSANLVFANVGPVRSFVEAIYFEDTSSFNLGINTPPTYWSYVEPPPPKKLPDGNTATPPFVTDFALLVDPPPQDYGIGIGTDLTVVLNFDSGFDILAALYGGELRVGLHTLGILDTDGRVVTQEEYDAAQLAGEDIGNVGDLWSYSESSINNIPEPASMVLIMASTVGLGFVRRRLMA